MRRRLEKCPVCGELTVKYESRFNGKRCSNPKCNWTETKLIAADVSKSFLKYCLEHADCEPRKKRIERIIIDTYGEV